MNIDKDIPINPEMLTRQDSTIGQPISQPIVRREQRVRREQEISQDDLEIAKQIIDKISEYYDNKIVGQEYLKYSLLIAILANGHILLESVPGLAKTTAAKTITEAIGGSFSRVQCTPDLLPSDIVGTQIFDMATSTFKTKIGPINANFLLLDEINRSSSKTQSAMLEAMQERSITIGGKLIQLPKPFVVIATQNPVEQEGTYNLAEAQLDRFLLKVKLGYPTPEEEMQILTRIESGVFNEARRVVSIEDMMHLQKLTKMVYMDSSIKQYITRIVGATRPGANNRNPAIQNYVAVGASTRASIAFMNVAKAMAIINGRNYCIPEDVEAMSNSILCHRLTLNFSAMADDIKVEDIIDMLFKEVVRP